MKKGQIESNTQSACVTWFRLQYPRYARLLFAVPNGGWRNPITARRLKSEGVTAGVSDLVLLVPNAAFHGLCVEMKTAIGRQSEEQRTWQRLVTEQGYCYSVCRDVQGFSDTVKGYLANTTEDGTEEGFWRSLTAL